MRKDIKSYICKKKKKKENKRIIRNFTEKRKQKVKFKI